jgi:hypothetical protein
MDTFVYCWTDHKTSKLYVGMHKGHPDDGYVSSSKHLIKEYRVRPQDFTREVLTRNTYEVCRGFEVAVIKAMFSQGVPCYNLNAAGAILYTPEIREKISQTHKGKVISAEHKAAIKQWNLTERKPASEETREKIRQKKLGVKRGALPEEWRRKISEAGKGLKRPEGFGAAVSARQLGKTRRPLTEAEKEKQRIAQTGRKHTPETLEKLRLAKANVSSATKLKLSEAKKRYWEQKRLEKQNAS